MQLLSSLLYMVLTILMLLKIKMKSSSEDITNLVSSIILIACAWILISNPRYETILLLSSFILTGILLATLLAIKTLSRIKGKIINSTVINGDESLWKEIFRKAFHFIVLILILPRQYLFYIYSSYIFMLNSIIPGQGFESASIEAYFIKDAIIIVSGSAVFAFILLELLRINFRIMLYPNILIRSVEEKTVAAHVYTAISIFFISMVFPESVLVPSIIIPILQDAMAAVVGRGFGKRVIARNRTLEGCLAGFLTGFLVGIYFLNILIALLVAAILEIADFLTTAININDNLLFPIIAAISISYISMFSM